MKMTTSTAWTWKRLSVEKKKNSVFMVYTKDELQKEKQALLCIWERNRIGYFVETPECHKLTGIAGGPVEFVWKNFCRPYHSPDL